jgi:hypothetical protein
MAKAKGVTNPSKINFGKRKSGSPQKSYNKHTPKPKQYKGQGR